MRFFQRIYALTELAALEAPPSGLLRSMDDSDENLIWEWMDGFVRDTGISVPVERFVQSLLNDRRFFLWDDNGPRSVVAAGRDTPHGACITAVYTPSEYRANGYASAAVAALSRQILVSGKQFCCLYTDLSNPTSNSIYAKIGYEPVRDDMELVFEQSRSYSAV